MTGLVVAIVVLQAVIAVLAALTFAMIREHLRWHRGTLPPWLARLESRPGSSPHE